MIRRVHSFFFFPFFSSFLIRFHLYWSNVIDYFKTSWKKTQFFTRQEYAGALYYFIASFPNSKYILVHSPHVRGCNIERKRLWNIPGRPSILYTLAISSSFIDTPLTSRIQSLFTLIVWRNNAKSYCVRSAGSARS